MILEEISNLLKQIEDPRTDMFEALQEAYRLLYKSKDMIQELKEAFNCEGCRGPRPLCHITGELECIRRPYFKGET